MKRYAIVENGVVTNPAVRAEAALNNNWLELPEGLAVQAGWRYENGTFIEPVVEDEPVKTKVPLTNIAVASANARLEGDIWWIPESEAFTLTADVPLPDGELMIMSERVIDGDTVVDDMRFIAVIEQGQVTINGKFKTSGNYQITAERLNKGLARIGQRFELAFSKIEFDAYV
ncbi:hypothetical protein [Pseudoalteromonas ruthenica]|uniref:hypothetical protein n=1 Tax=Pseudoalteromonas ruthenica TaxID=151081 RepID=UPI00110B4BE0|nr:hypothetical protein [Pseudoalteromonas ruthenica]TMO97539.1 hypothetical protein CWC07_13745 [Pseudoalteromonas ruthenica]